MRERVAQLVRVASSIPADGGFEVGVNGARRPIRALRVCAASISSARSGSAATPPGRVNRL